MQVYAIQNSVNGKLYIGQHAGKDLDWYLKENLSAARRGSTGKRLLYRAMRKHGPESFDIRMIHKATDKSDMDNAEKAYIKFFGTRNPELGYNLTDGGDGVLGLEFSEETKKRLRESAIERGGISDKCREAQKKYLENRVFSAEHKKKLSEARKGIVFSESHRMALSKAKKGKKLNLGDAQKENRRVMKREWWRKKKEAECQS